jgi:2,3-bisphosphoglycerate-independent phosphoglycerate mutase
VKLPRDLSGSDLAHLTVPEHDPLKIGTLAGILSDIGAHHKISKDDLVQKLF